MSAYPTGSTFKPITATAALESGDWTVGDVYDDTGVYSNGPGDLPSQRRAMRPTASLDLTEAIKVSSDDFFYNLGRVTNVDKPDGGPLQHWAHLYGIGQQDRDRPRRRDGGQPALAEMARGRRPRGAALRAQAPRAELRDRGRPPLVGRRQREPRRRPGRRRRSRRCSSRWPTRRSPTAARSCARTSASTSTRPTGPCCRRSSPPAARHISINPLYLDTIRAGLRDAASQPGGTSADVMGNFPEPVYGKTGTAQCNGQPD